MHRSLVLVFAIVMVSGCTPTWQTPVTSVTPATTRGGSLLLIGGGKKPDDVMRKFVELGGGERGRFVVLPLASGVADTGAYYVDLLEKYGARDIVVIPVDDRRDAERGALVEVVRSATAVFFPGGDQSRISSRLVGTPMLEAIRAVHDHGGVIGGTSAGTACQSEIMIVGGQPPEFPQRGAVRVTRGLGLLTDIIIDQHFVARGRHNRLLSVVLENPAKLGIGIDEGTAAWFRPDGVVEVMGLGSIVVFDARGGAVTEGDDRRLVAPALTTQVLHPGETFDLHTPTTARPQ